VSASSRLKSFRRVARAFRGSCIERWRRASCGSLEEWWLEGFTCGFAVVRLCGEGSICVKMSEGGFLPDGCDFRVCRACEGLWGNFFSRSWACNFWMEGVIRDTFLANALVNASLVSLSLRRLEWYRVRGGDD